MKVFHLYSLHLILIFLYYFITSSFFLSLYLVRFRLLTHYLFHTLFISPSFNLCIYVFNRQIFSHNSFIILLSLTLYLIHASPSLSHILSITFFFLRLSHSSYTLIISVFHSLTSSRSYEELQIVSLLFLWYTH